MGTQQQLGIDMKYFYWRGLSLYCTFQLPGYPAKYPLHIYALNNTPAEKRRCERLGELELARLRTEAVTGELTKKKVIEYNPRYSQLVARYWAHHLKFQKCAKSDKYHLLASLRYFWRKNAKDIKKTDIITWREKLKETHSINTINLRFSYLCCVYSWANQEDDPSRQLNYDPTKNLQKLPGGNIRTFVLTQEQFEKNYNLFKFGLEYKERPTKHHSFYKIPPNPNFAAFYLALWETMRRPIEVAQYTWEMITIIRIDDEFGITRFVRAFNVPPNLIGKTNEYDVVIISDRLWLEISGTINRTGLVFANSHGEQWTDWAWQQKQLRKVFGDKAGVIRDCRRGSITHVTEVEGADPRHVQMQSGHKTDSMFKRYRIGKMRHVHAMVNKTAFQGDVNVGN